MKASKLIKYLTDVQNNTGIDPEVSVVLEPEINGEKIQIEEDISGMVTSKRYVKEVLDLSSTRIILLGKSFEG